MCVGASCAHVCRDFGANPMRMPTTSPHPPEPHPLTSPAHGEPRRASHAHTCRELGLACVCVCASLLALWQRSSTVSFSSSLTIFYRHFVLNGVWVIMVCYVWRRVGEGPDIPPRVD